MHFLHFQILSMRSGTGHNPSVFLLSLLMLLPLLSPLLLRVYAVLCKTPGNTDDLDTVIISHHK